jgi:D-alanyl-D-alanine carboxypeptidase (penicillin-binding protein 5/6)
MNLRAATLGANNTQFTDVSGIDDSSRTTALDLACIARAAYQNKLYMQITSTTRYSCAKTLLMQAQTISNRNALIYSTVSTQYFNKKCQGMSAGSTPLAGSCVVTVASNGTESYLSIVMGGDVTEEKDFGYLVTNRLINWVYDAYTYMEVLTPDTLICSLPVTVSDMTTSVEIKAHDSLSCYLPRDAELGVDVTYSVRLIYSSLEAPVYAGTMVGYVAVLYRGEMVDTLPIYTAGDAERSAFVGSLKSLQALTQSRVFQAGAIFFVTILLAWIVIESILQQRRRHKWDKYFSTKMTPSPTAPDPTSKQPRIPRR